jgi:hypothetical protein
MAFPPDVPEQLYTGEVLREHIIPLREQTPLTQNSSHSANFVFGDVDLEGIEHNPGAPILKVSNVDVDSRFPHAVGKAQHGRLIITIAHRFWPGTSRSCRDVPGSVSLGKSKHVGTLTAPRLNFRLCQTR